MKYIVIMENRKNGRIVEAFGMKSKGFAFYFQNQDGEWVNPAFCDGAMAIAFKELLSDDSKFLYDNHVVFKATTNKYNIIVKEL